MTGYSDKEVTDVVSSLVKGTITRSYDTLGVRRTNDTFSEVQESAAGVFLLYPMTPFYLAFLAAERIRQDLKALGTYLGETLDQMRVLRRRVLPLKDISALENARVALFELEGQVSQKVPKEVAKVPAYQRVQANLDRFLKAAGGAIKDGKVIVPTPEEVRAGLPKRVEGIRAQTVEIKRKVLLLSRAIEIYSSLGLAQKVAGGVVSKARVMLDKRADELAKMGEQERLTVIRQVVLEVLGIKAAVKTFGQFKGPETLLELTGTGTPFSDSDRPGLPARLVVENPGPYVLVAGVDEASSTNILKVWLDGGGYPGNPPSTSFYLPLSQVAKIEGVIAEPFLIDGTNDQMSVSVNGGAAIPVSILNGAARMASQVAVNITSALVGTNFEAEAYFMPLKYDGGPISASGNTLTLAFGAFPQNSFQIGDLVEIYYGAANVGQVRSITTSPIALDFNTIVVGGAPLTAASDLRIRVGSSARKLRLVPIDKELAVLNRQMVQLKCPTDVERSAGYTLGLYGELLGKSVPTPAKVVADFIKQNSQVVSGSVEHMPVASGYQVRTDPSNAFLAVYYFAKGTVASYTAGATSTFTGTFDITALLAGHTLVIRSGADAGAVGVIDTVSASSMTVTFGSAVAGDVGATFETGPDTIAYGHRLEVPEGVNAGTYYVDEVDALIPFQFKLTQAWPLYRDGFNLGLSAQANIGPEHLAIESKNTSTLSEVLVYDAPLTFFTSVGPHIKLGTTRYFKLPSKPATLAIEDMLQFFVTDDLPYKTYEVERIDSDAVITLDRALPSEEVWSFNPGIAPPYARLKTRHVLNFTSFSENLVAWADKSALNTSAFFTDLNRLVNPLLVNKQPTDSSVGTAEAKLLGLYALLTQTGATRAGGVAGECLESILGQYLVNPVPQVDTLLRTFKERGADRAIDLLLECQFGTFFGLDQEGSTYAGDFQKKIRAVATNDLPVRKGNRLASTVSQHRGTSESTDFEVDTSDTDESATPDPSLR